MVVLVSSVLIGWNLDAYSLINVTEARQAEIARQMWLTHDWITPRYNGEPYFDKPALLHWLIAIGFSLFGPQEWVVRLPSAMSAIALLLSTWLFLNAVATRRLALLATVILAANPFTWALGRIGFHDMLMVCCLTLALYAWFWADLRQHKVPYLGSFGALALAILAKGPLALLLFILILTVFYLWSGKGKRRLAQVPWGWGLLVLVAIAGPWYGLVIHANGWDYIHYFFGDSNVNRFLSVNQNQWGPWYYYLLSLAIFFFPWVVQVPTAIIRTLRDRWPPTALPPRTLDQFAVAWGLTVLIFMSLAATKLSWYLYPGLPAFAYLSARSWEQHLIRPRRSWTVVLIGCVYAGIAVAIATGNLGDPNLVSSLDAAHLRYIWAGLFAGAAAVIALSLQQRRASWMISAGIILFGCIGLTGAHLLMPVLDVHVLDQQLIPIAQTLEQLTCETCETDLVATLGLRLPSLNFYSGHTHIERFEQICQIPEQVSPDQRLLLVTTVDTMDDLDWSVPPAQFQQQSGQFRLLQFLPAEPIILDQALQDHCSNSIQ